MADNTITRLAIPKGRMYDGAVRLLGHAGIELLSTARDYRPAVSLAGFDVKVLKPQAVIEMLAVGARDVGFAGSDWVAEFDADLVELVDTGLDPVRLVAAAPPCVLTGGGLPERPIVVASEYERLTRLWIDNNGLDATFVRSFGATEVLPPEDADCIVDNTATGATLSANGLVIIDELMTSSTRLYASKAAMESVAKRERIEELVLLVRSVLEARKRVMVEVNVPADRLEAVLGVLPCMREPTIAQLGGSGGYAVKSAVSRSELARIVPRIKAAGGTDIVVFTPEQIVI